MVGEMAAGSRRSAALASAAMRKVNPAFIPRNHRIEAVIQAAMGDDFAPVRGIADGAVEALRRPAAFAAYAKPPQDEERVTQTFCGT